MMPRRRVLLEEGGESRWLVSYADFVTLLFAFFVVMYAAARAGNAELTHLSDSLSGVFEATPRALEPIQVGDPLLAASPHVVDVSPEAGYADPEEGDTRIQPAVDDLVERFAGLEGIDAPDVAVDQDWLEISLGAEVLFAPGSATLQPAALPLLAELVAFLGGFDNPVTVEGYTDNVPTGSGRFPSNWELSAFRASVVARYFEDAGLERGRISAVGYGENHPRETNATPEGRASNRRVDVIVARRGNLGRNRNAQGQASAFAHVRQSGPVVLDESVNQVRKEDGGLLFTNESASRAD